MNVRSGCYCSSMRASRREWLVSVVSSVAVFAQSTPKRVVLLLGPPGAGKTTQAEKLKAALGVPVISMSDVLRRAGGGKRTDLNKALKKQIAGGELLSDEVANDLIRERITRKDAARGFIMDGYPATAKQAEFFDATLADLGLPAPVVIHLSIPDSVADSRLSQRGRADDSSANIERRIVDYREQAALILARYPGAVKTIDGTQSPDSVAQAVRKAAGL